MKNYLEVTYREGRAVAAYLYLPRETGDKSARTQKVHPGLVIDFSHAGRPIGIEITAPAHLTVELLNRALGDLGLPPIDAADLAPLRAA